MTFRGAFDWQDKDVVTHGASGRLGRVVVLKRKRDGQPFFMVEPARGPREWTDGWLLGSGPFGGSCLSCAQEFRAPTKEDADFCPTCRRTQRQDGETPTIRNVAQYGIKWSKGEKPVTEADRARFAELDAQAAKEDEEMPF